MFARERGNGAKIVSIILARAKIRSTFHVESVSERGKAMEEERLQVVVERFCLCDGKHHTKKACRKWKPVQNATNAQFKAFTKLVDYLNKYNPEVWSGDIVTLDYAKYRVRAVK